MNKIVLAMIEKENNKRSHFFGKDTKSIPSFIKEVADIKGKRFIFRRIIIKKNTCLKH